MQHWLMKSEPDAFSIDDLERRRTEPWTGVRNFVARNYMREMAIGDRVLFYHSNAEPPGVAGLATVCATSHIDDTQFDPAHMYFDERAKLDAPRWDCVDVAYAAPFANYVSLERMRHDAALEGMMVLMKGMRLSVQPVSAAHYARVVAMSKCAWEPPPPPPKPPRGKKAPTKKAKK